MTNSFSLLNEVLDLNKIFAARSFDDCFVNVLSFCRGGGAGGEGLCLLGNGSWVIESWWSYKRPKNLVFCSCHTYLSTESKAIIEIPKYT